MRDRTKNHLVLALGTSFLALVALAFVSYTVIDSLKVITRVVIPLGLLSVVLPVSIVYYHEYQYKRSVEKQFPMLLRDIAESLRAGMTVPEALHSLSSVDYGRMTPDVRKMSHQASLDLGIKEIFNRFQEKTDSDIVDWCVETMNDAHKAGGDLPDVLSSISKAISTINKLHDKRRSKMHQFALSNYIIFFAFVAILIVLHKILGPFIVGSAAGVFFEQQASISDYYPLFVSLISINGVFMGLVIGKTSSGSIIPGIKHSVILTVLGYFLFNISISVL